MLLGRAAAIGVPGDGRRQHGDGARPPRPAARDDERRDIGRGGILPGEPHAHGIEPGIGIRRNREARRDRPAGIHQVVAAEAQSVAAVGIVVGPVFQRHPSRGIEARAADHPGGVIDDAPLAAMAAGIADASRPAPRRAATRRAASPGASAGERAPRADPRRSVPPPPSSSTKRPTKGCAMSPSRKSSAAPPSAMAPSRSRDALRPRPRAPRAPRHRPGARRGRCAARMSDQAAATWAQRPSSGAHHRRRMVQPFVTEDAAVAEHRRRCGRGDRRAARSAPRRDSRCR